MAAVEAILAVIGLFAVVGFAVALMGSYEPPPRPLEDVAEPYREGLHAAVRMQKVAADLEQQIYAEAAKHSGSDGSGAP
jgi:hypothetical protein